jgi:hypothetical protein
MTLIRKKTNLETRRNRGSGARKLIAQESSVNVFEFQRFLAFSSEPWQFWLLRASDDALPDLLSGHGSFS